MHSPLLNVFVVMVLCNATWAFFFFGIYKRGVDYTHHFLWTTAYFLASAALLSFIFWKYISDVLQPLALAPLIVLAVFMLCQSAFYTYFPKYFAEPTEYFKKYPNRYYLKIEWRRLVAKSADILAQQVFIVLLVLLLKELGLPLYQILLYFGILFTLLHVPLIASEYPAWPSLLFAGAVVVFSIIFPTLILFVPYGFAYNMILHWLFYTFTATTFWIWWNASSDHG